MRKQTEHGFISRIFFDCGKKPAEVIWKQPMKNRVTVTVRQDGREIVCTLSAVTVFFVFQK